jgi:hypothetical protein
MICIAGTTAAATRDHGVNGVRHHPGRPLWFVEETRSAADWGRCDEGHRLDLTTADLLLDHAFAAIANGQMVPGLQSLVEGLAHLRGNLGPGDWSRFRHSVWAHHPIGFQLREERMRRLIARMATANRGFAVLYGLIGAASMTAPAAARGVSTAAMPRRIAPAV